MKPSPLLETFLFFSRWIKQVVDAPQDVVFAKLANVVSLVPSREEGEIVSDRRRVGMVKLLNSHTAVKQFFRENMAVFESICAFLVWKEKGFSI